MTRLVQNGVVASLMLIHDLYPVDREPRVHEALEERCGRTSSRRAATWSWSASRTAWRSCDCAAAARAVRRRPRRWSSRSRTRSRKPRPTWPASRSRACARRPPLPRAVIELPMMHSGAGMARRFRCWGTRTATARAGRPPGRSSRVQCRTPGRTVPMTVGGAELLRRQRGRHAARIPQRLRLVPGAARRRADGAGRNAHMPLVRAPVRAAASRPLTRRRGSCRSRRCRCSGARGLLSRGWRAA